jgi:hypothetical protein
LISDSSAGPDPDQGAGHTGLHLTPELAASIDARLTVLRLPLAERALSDGTFSNLRLFRTAHEYRYQSGPWPCITGRSYDGTATVLPLFDIATAPVDALRALQGRDGWFFPIADEVLARMNPTSVEFHALRDDSDYLYSAAAFLDYDAAGLRSKRQAVARLLAVGRVEVSCIGAGNRDAALAVLEGWCADKGRGPTEADAPACREALSTLVPGGALFGFLHETDGMPIGFVLVELLNPGVLVVRFAKGRTNFDGIFPYLFQDLVRRVQPAVQWLNFEQDLGHPNFRRTKLSFRPAALLTKHRVRLRAD